MRHFFLISIAMIATLGAYAQDEHENSLFSTTGPNVIGSGKIELSGALDYYSFSESYEYPNPYSMHYDMLGTVLGARFGIGHRAELTIGLGGHTTSMQENLVSHKFFSNVSVTPSVGARLLLFGGRNWIPLVTFHTQVSFPLLFGKSQSSSFYYDVQPLIALQFRNRMGERWALDYSIGYTWGKTATLGTNLFGNLRYSVFARWLATERFMLGFGIENSGGKIEALWQVRPNLQLKAQTAFSAGFGGGVKQMESYSLIGINWMVR